jgi:hypothetical protein
MQCTNAVTVCTNAVTVSTNAVTECTNAVTVCTNHVTMCMPVQLHMTRNEEFSYWQRPGYFSFHRPSCAMGAVGYRQRSRNK